MVRRYRPNISEAEFQVLRKQEYDRYYRSTALYEPRLWSFEDEARVLFASNMCDRELSESMYRSIKSIQHRRQIIKNGRSKHLFMFNDVLGQLNKEFLQYRLPQPNTYEQYLYYAAFDGTVFGREYPYNLANIIPYLQKSSLLEYADIVKDYLKESFINGNDNSFLIHLGIDKE